MTQSPVVTSLRDKKILLVEDEALIAAMAADMLANLGATVVGPAGSLSGALALATSADCDAAVLDVNLRGERVDPVAAVLGKRGIPVLFATGYGAGANLGHLTIDKPYTQDKLAQGLVAVLAAGV